MIPARTKTTMTKNRPDWPPELKAAFELRQAGHTDEAIDAFRQALNLHPNHARGWWLLGGLLRKQRDHREAASAFARAAALRPTNEDFSSGLFHSFVEAGMTTEAISEARRFLGEVKNGARCSEETLRAYIDWDGDGPAIATAWRAHKK